MWLLFCFKQKTAYEMRISDWSSDVCSSDLQQREEHPGQVEPDLEPEQLEELYLPGEHPGLHRLRRIRPAAGRATSSCPAPRPRSCRPPPRAVAPWSRSRDK